MMGLFSSNLKKRRELPRFKLERRAGRGDAGLWRGVRTQEFDGARRAPTRKGGHGPEAQAPGRVDERQDLRLAPPLDGEIAGPGRDRAARVDAGIMRNQRLGFGDSRKVPPHAVRQRSDRARRDGRALVDALEVDGHRLVPSPFSPAQHEFPIAHRPRLLEPLIHVRAAVGARPLARIDERRVPVPVLVQVAEDAHQLRDRRLDHGLAVHGAELRRRVDARARRDALGGADDAPLRRQLGGGRCDRG